MRTFTIESTSDPEDNPFDRQQRIEWWSQEKIGQAKIMVVGAGAIGNETLKNLALLGVRNIFIVDFDTISKSNLSRTVLFRRSDVDKKKAQIAAERIRDLCLADNPNIDWFHGDLVWELGTGVYRDMDLVLGCLDNVETRLAINRQCRLAQTPWIDSGINELALHVSFYIPSMVPCYECGTTEEQRIAARHRYSCDDFKRAMSREGKMPTVQIASSIASAIQVQEAMKYICDQQIMAGKKIFFQGKINDFDVNQIQISPTCTAHIEYPEITRLPIATSISLRNFLTIVSRPDYSGDGAVLDFSADRTFVASVVCRSCGDRIEFFKPAFRVFDTETICEKCQIKGISLSHFDPTVTTDKVVISEFGLYQTENRVLNMTLRDLGVPLWHVVAVKDLCGNYRYYELSSDKEVVLPNISKGESHNKTMNAATTHSY